MGHREGLEPEVVTLRENPQGLDGFAAVGAVVIDQRDGLAGQLFITAFLTRDIGDHGVGLGPIGGRQGEDVGEDSPVAGVGPAVAHGDDRNPVFGGALDQRIGDAGRQRAEGGGAGGAAVLELLVACHAAIGVVAGIAFLDDQRHAADPAIALVEHGEIIGEPVGERDAVRCVWSGAVDHGRNELEVLHRCRRCREVLNREIRRRLCAGFRDGQGGRRQCCREGGEKGVSVHGLGVLRSVHEAEQRLRLLPSAETGNQQGTLSKPKI